MVKRVAGEPERYHRIPAHEVGLWSRAAATGGCRWRWEWHEGGGSWGGRRPRSPFGRMVCGRGWSKEVQRRLRGRLSENDRPWSSGVLRARVGQSDAKV